MRQPVSWALPAGKGSPVRWANMAFQAVLCKYVLRPHPHSVPITDACVMREPFRALVNRGSFRMLIELPNLNNFGYCKCNYSYQLGLEFWVFGEVIPNILSRLTYLDLPIDYFADLRGSLSSLLWDLGLPLRVRLACFQSVLHFVDQLVDCCGCYTVLCACVQWYYSLIPRPTPFLLFSFWWQ